MKRRQFGSIIEQLESKAYGSHWKAFVVFLSLRFEFAIAFEINGKLFIGWAGVCTLGAG